MISDASQSNCSTTTSFTSSNNAIFFPFKKLSCYYTQKDFKNSFMSFKLYV
ncbi:hypothetical protein [Candidatus Marinarcus aquaticus]|uniref:hypothetical protein n=1 Tax=Candidatus Marinarcus aquaticus TaxID=2044504 RepID=UPI003AF3D712